MAKVAPTAHKPPDAFSKWRRVEGDGEIYEVLDNDCPTKIEAGAAWRNGVLYARAERSELPGKHRTYHRTLEAFYAEMEPAR